MAILTAADTTSFVIAGVAPLRDGCVGTRRKYANASCFFSSAERYYIALVAKWDHFLREALFLYEVR